MNSGRRKTVGRSQRPGRGGSRGRERWFGIYHLDSSILHVIAIQISICSKSMYSIMQAIEQ